MNTINTFNIHTSLILYFSSLNTLTYHFVHTLPFLLSSFTVGKGVGKVENKLGNFLGAYDLNCIGPSLTFIY